MSYGIFLHFGMSTFTGNEFDPGLAPSSVYAPSNPDPRQWIGIAKKAGGNLLLNVGPNREGRLEAWQISALMELKRRIDNGAPQMTC